MEWPAHPPLEEGVGVCHNEVNELTECMLYKMFCFSGKHLKTVKLSFTIIFQKPCLLPLKFLKLYVLAL